MLDSVGQLYFDLVLYAIQNLRYNGGPSSRFSLNEPSIPYSRHNECTDSMRDNDTTNYDTEVTIK